MIDASQMMAGPLCGMRLGDLGAEVIKLEPPAGEWVRSHGFAGAELAGETTAHLGLNRNKRSVVVNLKSPKGREVVYDLIRHADVFIQNYRVGTAERIGIGAEELRRINPRLVYCSVTGYGPTGPYAARPGQDLVIQGYSGSMWSVGGAEDPPQPGAMWAADAMAAYQAAIGILAALIARGRTGEGQHVEVNLLAATLDCQIQELVTYLNVGMLPERPRARSAHAFVPAPYGVYRTADSWLTLAMSPPAVLGEFVDSDRLRAMDDWDDGVTHRDEIYAIVTEAVLERSTAEWIARADSLGLWAGPVYNYADLAEDEHVQATGMLIDVDHETIGQLRMPAPPIRMSETPVAVTLAPPLLDAHTDEVLRDLLGYEDDQLTQLRTTGAIGAMVRTHG